jgi:hypothetical protein
LAVVEVVTDNNKADIVADIVDKGTDRSADRSADRKLVQTCNNY